MGKTVENYMIQQPIGEGNFAKVFKAKHIRTGQDFAIKVISAEKFKDIPKLEQCTVNEINILSKIRNESDYIVKYIDMLKTSNNFYFVYEFCNGGTLDKLIQKEGHFPQYKALRYLKQILQGFKVLNKYNIMHRDLKPENILLHNGNIKLADFSFCKLLENKNDLTQTMLGSPIYMAPEVLKGEIYTMKADIWSMGIVLYKMLFGKCPYEQKSIAMLINRLDKSDLELPSEPKVSALTEQFLRKVLVKNPNERMNWDQIFNFYHISEQGQIMHRQDTNNQMQMTAQLRSSLKVYPTQIPSIMRTSYPSNAMGYNPTMLNAGHYQVNPMSMVSPKSSNQILQIPPTNSNGGINRSFQPYNEVQSPLLDKNMLGKKSPYKLQQQRNTVDYRNISSNQVQQNGNNFRSNSIAQEVLPVNFYQSQPNFNSNESGNKTFKLAHQNSIEINMNSKESKNDRSGLTRIQILTKIHQKCIQINQIVLEIFSLDQHYSNYVCYFLFKNVCKEIQSIYDNLKKQSVNQAFLKQFKSIVQSQFLHLNKMTANFYDAILEQDKEIKILNQKSNKSLDEQLFQNKQRILKLYIEHLNDSDQHIRLAAQVVDYLLQNFLIKREAYERMSRDHLYKQMKNKIFKQ